MDDVQNKCGVVQAKVWYLVHIIICEWKFLMYVD